MSELLHLVAVITFITAHAADNKLVQLNVAEMSSIREPPISEGHFDKDVHCVIVMTNSKLIGVIESCREIIQKIKGAE